MYYHFFHCEIRLPTFDDGKESVMKVETHVLRNHKYCNSLHSKSFDVYLISCDLYSKRNLVIANIYMYFYLYNVLILRLILYDVYLRMIRCYEEKVSDFRLKTEESESSSDSYKDLNDTRERIRLLQLESEWRHQ